MFTKGYRDKWGCRAVSPLGLPPVQQLAWERRACRSTRNEARGLRRASAPPTAATPPGLGRGAEQPRAAGHLAKQANFVRLCKSRARAGGGGEGKADGRALSAHESQRVTERPGAERDPAGSRAGPSGGPAADSRPRGFPALRRVLGKRQCRSRCLLQ